MAKPSYGEVFRHLRDGGTVRAVNASSGRQYKMIEGELFCLVRTGSLGEPRTWIRSTLSPSQFQLWSKYFEDYILEEKSDGL